MATTIIGYKTMAYYGYNIQTGRITSFSADEEEAIIVDNENEIIETSDLFPDFTKKVVNGTLVVDQERVAEVAANEVREKRQTLLAETDWWAVADRTMTQAETDYRQALRDVPAQAGFPENVTWPTKP
jgi:uncharacterized protein YlzI (FlbEa/FlbD family)